MIDGITFLSDEDGNDTGEWTTEEDKMDQEILDEDMGVKLNFGCLDLLSYKGEERVLNNADDAYVMTFGSALGAERNLFDNEEDAVVPGACHTTIAPEEGATSGAGSV
jgi:hypothetical protein